MLYLGVSETHEAQAKIIRALTRKFPLEPSLSIDDISLRCPFNYTGADFYALCSDALLNAMSRKAEEVDRIIDVLNEESEGKQPRITPQLYLSELAPPSLLNFTVGLEDFDNALTNLIPSVSKAEMEYYHQIQNKFGS